jgi:hypothetical protein
VKKWFESKTLWFNIITLVLGVTGAVVGIIRSEEWIIILAVVNALGNGILRIWFTESAIVK